MIKKLGFILAVLPTCILAQHTIKGNFSPAEDFDNAILYKITPTSSEYIGFGEVDDNGNFEIQLDSSVAQGMLRLVYALPQDEYNFDIIYNAKEDIELTFTPAQGVQFQSSIENTLITSYTNSMSLVTQEIGNFYRNESTDTLALASIFKTQKETQTKFEEAAEGTLASHFIKANQPYIPEQFEDIRTYIQNLRVHFFDHVNFNDNILQSSDFLIERILNFVFGMRNEGLDELTSYKKNIDDMVVIMEDALPEIKSLLLEVLWQQMVDANNEAIANHISNNYLKQLAQSMNDEELLNGLKLFESLSIGNKAPDFSFEFTENNNTIATSLNELEGSDKYILIFWSSTCGHCLREMPQLQSYMRGFETGEFKVIAFGMEDEPENWNKEIQKYPGFIHIYGKDKWNNTTARNYNVRSTPTYYVLDKDKTIISKPYDFQALKKLYDQ